MNIFILNTGRCGSTTFIRACEHISNFSAGHETRIALPGTDRLAYPANHIEADNRLSWFLGRLDETFGQQALYVHLQRDRQQTINSFIRRMDFGIMQAYANGIYLDSVPQDPSIFAADYVDTVTANIRLFLRDKPNSMVFQLERAAEDFARFWQWIGAEGNLKQALDEWQVSYNAS